MSKLADTMAKPLGPLPTGVWIALVGGGLGVSYLLNRGGGDSGGEDTLYQEVPTGGAESNLSGAGPGGWFFSPAPNVTPPGPATPQTNEEWGRQAISWLLSQNYPAALADSAIRKYLAVVPLSPQEQTLIDLVLRHMGGPPQILPPVDGDVAPNVPIPDPSAPQVPGAPPPPPPGPGTDWAQTILNLLARFRGLPRPTVTVRPPPPQPPARTFVVTQWPAMGSSLWTISMLMYGTPFRWSGIYQANRQIIGPDANRIQPGMRLVIP